LEIYLRIQEAFIKKHMKIVGKLIGLILICTFIYSCTDHVNEATDYRLKQIVLATSSGHEYQKQVLNYNNGKLITKFIYQKDTSESTWIEKYHINFNYAGDSIVVISSDYDIGTTRWKDYYKDVYTVSDGKVINLNSYDLERSIAYPSYEKYQYVGGNLIEIYTRGRKFTFTSNNNQRSSYLEHDFINNQWIFLSETRLSYTDNQIQSLFIYNVSIDGVTAITPSTKYLYEYTDGKISKQTIWVYNLSAWKANTVINYSYIHGCLAEEDHDNRFKTINDYPQRLLMIWSNKSGIY